MMKKTKLIIWNERMLLFIDHCLEAGIVDTQRDFLESIGFPPTNIGQVRRGLQSFTLEHLRNASSKYQLNINWIVGLETDMKRRPAKTPIQQLKDAVKAVELSM